MNEYPKLMDKIDDVPEVLRRIIKERPNDIADFNKLKNTLGGRKVGKIPTSSNDVADTDSLGDFNFTDTDYYLLVDDAGSAKWRKITLATF